MPFIDPKHPLFQLLQRDRRYTLEAYLFVLEALSFAQESLGMGQQPAVDELEPLPADETPSAGTVRGKRGRGRAREAERHVSGQQLCEAARLYGLQQYGYLAPTVLARWGIRATDDFGAIVFNMVEIGQMRKTRSDRREDFRNVFDFADGFSRDLSFVVPDPV
ncbi:MAG: Minf_1886 family protein [Planctomycetaceae bacterium]